MIDEAYEKTVFTYCKGYPPEFRSEEYSHIEEIFGICLNGSVFDMKNMRLLKLSSENFIMWGYYGFH